MEDGPDYIVSGWESIIKRSDVRREICVVSDQGPVVVPKLAAVPLALPVVEQTRPQVGCGAVGLTCGRSDKTAGGL